MFIINKNHLIVPLVSDKAKKESACSKNQQCVVYTYNCLKKPLSKNKSCEHPKSINNVMI